MKRRLVAVFAGLLAAPLAALTPPLLPPIDGGPDFQVNVTSQGPQETPDVARDAAGDFAVVWADRPEGGTQTRLMVRLFESSGAPKTGEILVWPLNDYFEPRPRIAMTPQGAFVVVWANQAGIGMRRFDRFGQPDGAAFVIDPAGSLDKWAPDVAMDAAGNVAVVWTQNSSQKIFLQRLDAEDRPLEAPRQVDQASKGPRGYPRVALNAAGSLLVSWDDYRENKPDVYARRFDGPSGSWAPEVRVHADPAGTQQDSALVLHPEGDGLVLYHDQNEQKIFGQRLDAAGALLGGAIEIGDAFAGQPDVAAALNGKMLAVWSGDGFDGLGVYGHLLERDGKSLSHPFLISTPSSVYDWYPAVAGGSQQGFAVAWNNGDFFTLPITPPPPRDGRDGSLSGVFARAFVGRCLAGSDVLCLGGGRFEVRVSWRNPATGGIGSGRVLPLTNDTGAFWFFGTDNLELMVKVLDG
ncbi:MAG TPA: hypothetical protein VG477_20415, partial [Thermoanaerobaculia bacterium]|nr:hypothetical protein [Thermoanaerobaculia bacterium]